MIDFLRDGFRVSIRRACRAAPACRATYHYRSRRPEQALLRKRIREIAETRMRYGYRRITVLLRREGWHVNVKRCPTAVSAGRPADAAQAATATGHG
jgi:putative transposase